MHPVQQAHIPQAQTLTELPDQVHLVIAVVLLQTIGLFHQKADERAISNLYHGMLVMMIRRSGLISQNSSWMPVPSSAETMWNDWVCYEMTKRQAHSICSNFQRAHLSIRALLLSYLHDCCQSIYFGLPPSYIPGEITLRLPCEEALWKAGSAEEWLAVLQTPVPRQSSQSRLTGHDYSATLVSMVQVDPNFVPTPNLSPFSYFILIHVILRDLFTTCTETTPLATDDRSKDDEDNQAMMAVQYALHHWLHSWRSSRPERRNTTEEPPFIENGELVVPLSWTYANKHSVLPLYWLGHVAILAHQEGLPPFNSAENVRGEMRFNMVKRWLKRIRAFLTESRDEESTLFWDELMKIQLQTWQLDGAEDQDGLLGFFPDL